MVEEPVEDRRRQHLVVEDLPPVHETLVGGDDRRRLLVPAGQKPEEEPRMTFRSMVGWKANYSIVFTQGKRASLSLASIPFSSTSFFNRLHITEVLSPLKIV